ncbi:MAG: Low conductance mechanosensitive channel YnaI [Alphaproteobacteria bacterium MarineAlpha5_Bin5]|nr:MAG: Low conductance mechanosensitive channel YnaI [Alphaproteobacteria bacterium MarineAlpha5_Bin5]PPR51379.1 MAG: Low conductance mechanosensitive channel YnaI [Alphaproteobacteria bacterium MarineAlpha5_Bin4]|tara:strand:+ start:2278 stop:3405 length:1128 start_codon:yes stop_codon:yes gene_type:complete
MKAFNQFLDLFREIWVQGIFGINVSEIIVGLIIFLFFYVLRRLFARFLISRLNKIVLRSNNQIDDAIIEVIEGPLKFLPVVIGFFIASSYVNFSSNVQDFIDLINRSLITIFIFWLLHQLVIPFSFLIKKFESKISKPLVDWTLRGLKILIFILGIVAILELWGIKVGPVIAGLGLFGVAVALGAQDLFKNLISGIMILMERRFTIGDVILVSGEVEGVVEQIGFRSTLIRRFDSTPVMVPNYKFAEQSVTNHTRRHHRRIRWLIGLEYRTTIDQLINIRDEINELIENEKDFAKNVNTSHFVRIDSFSESSIDMLVQAFTETNDWGEYLKIKENLAVKIIEIIERNNAGFAFPSQSIYMESMPSDKPEILNPKK